MGESGHPAGANPEFRHRLSNQAVGMPRSCRATTIKARNEERSLRKPDI
jgi:hypothetical protein